jgi:hypothetical protein
MRRTRTRARVCVTWIEKSENNDNDLRGGGDNEENDDKIYDVKYF